MTEIVHKLLVVKIFGFADRFRLFQAGANKQGRLIPRGCPAGIMKFIETDFPENVARHLVLLIDPGFGLKDRRVCPNISLDH
ncbi:MAG: hypothetical protein ACTS1Z_15105 [Parasphingopyxis sp.]